MSAETGPKAMPYRALTREEVKKELAKLDIDQAVLIARHYTDGLRLEADDLMSEAACRALTTRRCREELIFSMFFSGVMRSIASSARKRAERREEDFVHLPVDDVAERMALVGYVVPTPEDVIETEKARTYFADLLKQLAADQPLQAALIDGIGMGLRGKALADHLGIPQEKLATAQRALKRRAQRLWPEDLKDRKPTQGK